MKNKNAHFAMKDGTDYYFDGEVVVNMDPLGFYVILNKGKMFGINSEMVSSYTYEVVEENKTPSHLGDNVHSLN